MSNMTLSLAAEAYLYGYPLVECIGEIIKNTAINRYSIGDRAAGVKYNADGSLDIYIQTTSPGPNKKSN